MRRAQTLCLIGFVSILSTSCASALKRQCEATNWFNYGESVAQSGRRMGDDTFIKQCEDEEVDVDHAAANRGFQQGYAQYCTPEAAFLLGKRGEFLSATLCDGAPQERTMKTRHAEGVREFCQASNGLPIGASGRKYNQICPKDLEKAFLVKFNEGRKKYLGIVISDSEARITSLDTEISDVSRRRDSRQRELEILMLSKPRMRTVSAPSNATGDLGKVKQANPALEEWERRYSDLRRQVGNLEEEIQGKRSQQDQLRTAIREARTELAGL